MADRPPFWRPEVAAAFADPRVAASYRQRPPYPPRVFPALLELLPRASRTVLDLGCGTGRLARPLAPRVDRVDAVDAAEAMIEAGRRLPGGGHPRLRWILGGAEDAPLQPPYGLATAGESLHWMDWAVVLPRLAAALAPGGRLAILDLDAGDIPADPALRSSVREVVVRFSTLRDWRPVDLVARLQAQGLFREEGRRLLDPVPFRQPVAAYVESFHARAGLAWARMPAARAAAFDAELRQVLAERADGMVTVAVRATIVWGRPLAGHGAKGAEGPRRDGSGT